MMALTLHFCWTQQKSLCVPFSDEGDGAQTGDVGVHPIECTVGIPVIYSPVILPREWLELGAAHIQGDGPSVAVTWPETKNPSH